MRPLFYLLTLLTIASACENDLEEVNRLFNPEATAVEVARDIEMLYSDSAVVRVRISGPTMVRHLDKLEPRQEFPDGLMVEFFGPGRRVDSRLTSKYATRLDKKTEIVVRDSVVWESNNGERLETEELVWDEKSGKVYSNRFVTLRRPGEILYGVGFEAEQDFSKSRIRAIEGRLRVEE